jgi:hypothetical protein
MNGPTDQTKSGSHIPADKVKLLQVFSFLYQDKQTTFIHTKKENTPL